jgi:hypothetical protein
MDLSIIRAEAALLALTAALLSFSSVRETPARTPDKPDERGANHE